VRDGSPLAALREGEAGVEVTTRAGETFHARYLVGADGAASRVTRLAGLRRKKCLGIALEVEVAADGDLLEQYADTALFIFGATPWGYLWIFPKAERLSAGIGNFSGQSSALHETLRREMGRLGVAVDGQPQRGHPLPIYLRHEPLQRGGVLLAGDAAGLVDPLMGEGVRHAITSGRFAAEAVLAGNLAGYTRRMALRAPLNLLVGLGQREPVEQEQTRTSQ
jgi:flavin-dependent dehydrogenase